MTSPTWHSAGKRPLSLPRSESRNPYRLHASTGHRVALRKARQAERRRLEDDLAAGLRALEGSSESDGGIEI
jgi:hypothetical protein